MNNQLAKITESGQSALRIIKAVGPFLISLSKKASESYADHQIRLAKIDVARDFMIKEIESLSNIRNNLRTKFFESTEEERIRIKRDIEYTERELRRLDIVTNALERIPELDNEDDKQTTETEKPEISPHWMDKFNEFARANNEDWRKELLTKALAIEAKNPGRIGPRALWVIGTIDDYLFHAFASLLDISSNILGYIVPNHQKFNTEIIPNCVLDPNKSIGNLVFLLSDLGLIGDTLSSQKTIPKSVSILASYGKHTALLTTKKELNIRGIIPTRLGMTLASLYEPNPNELGLTIYNEWLQKVDEASVDKNILA